MKRAIWTLCVVLVISLALSGTAFAGKSEANGKVNEATDSNFRNEVQLAGVPVLCVFSADWCKYCKKLKPVLGDIAKEYKGRVKVVVVDTDSNPDCTNKYRVKSLPSLFMHSSGGSVTGEATGYMEKDQLIRRFGLDEY